MQNKPEIIFSIKKKFYLNIYCERFMLEMPVFTRESAREGKRET